MSRRLLRLVLGSGLGVVLILALSVMTFGFVPVLDADTAAAAPVAQAGGNYVSGVTVQNLNNVDPATVVIKFYNADGVQQPPLQGVTATLAGGTQRTWYLPSHVPELPSGFIGSAVVESDQPVMATVNTQTPSYPATGNSNSNPFRAGTSVGVDQDAASITAYLPQVMKKYTALGWNSYFAVQNTASSTTDVTVRYIDTGSGAEITEARQTRQIPANASFVYRQIDNTWLPSNWSGSVIVTATQPVATVVNFYNNGADASNAQFHSYNGFSAGATRLFIPRVVRRYYDYNSGLRVQNVSGSTANVQITYYFPGQAAVTKSMSLAPGQAGGPYLGADNSETSGLPNGASGSAVVTSNVPVVATVNEDNRVLGRGVTYGAVPDGSQSQSVFFPQVTSRYYGYSSGVQVQNVGSSPATGSAVFRMAGRDPVTVAFSIPANASWQIFAPNAGVGADFNGSVSVTANQSIVGIANMSFRGDVDNRYSEVLGDTFLTYNGANTN